MYCVRTFLAFICAWKSMDSQTKISWEEPSQYDSNRDRRRRIRRAQNRGLLTRTPCRENHRCPALNLKTREPSPVFLQKLKGNAFLTHGITWKRLEKVPMKESRWKCFLLYDSICMKPLDWEKSQRKKD